MVDSVDKLKELLFQQEAATLTELDHRIARVAEAEMEARTQIASSLHQLEQIRRLGDESRDLHERLERRFADLNARTGTAEALRSSVAQVLDEAIVEARQVKQEDLSRALAPMLVRTIKAELKNNQAEMVEALYPITGQLVRAYVASAMRDLTKRLNRGLQSNGFMIRLRSLFSGYSIAELRLAETQGLEVEELFLIRRGSGELIRRFPESLQRSNSDAHMSGVLAAINDFAANAFEGEGGHLRSFDLDDFTLFLRASPVYLLAAKCRGVPAPGVEGLIDAAFLDAVGQVHAVDTPDADASAPIRLLAGLKTRIEDGVGKRHDELSSAGMPFNPVRALAALGIIALIAAGGWFGWITWEVEQTRAATREAIASTAAMSGYPVTVEVGSRGRSVAISGLAPSEAARSQVMTAIATALPGVVVEDRGLAALPLTPPDLSAPLASVQKDLGRVESTLRSEVELVAAEAARRTTLSALDRARRSLQQALPDLAALGVLPPASTGALVTSVQRSVAAASDGLAQQVSALSDQAASNVSERAAIDAAIATAEALYQDAGRLAGLIGRQPATSKTAVATRPAGSLPEAAEQASLAAQRVATVAALALQAASLRAPEPTPVERLRAFAQRTAIFFGNNEEYRDPATAKASLDEIARLAKEARVLVRAVGYTDERGTQTRNTPLAQLRADKVARELVSRGVPRDLVVAVGRATGPDLSPATGPESANRRAEFEVGFAGEPGAVP